MADVIKWDQPLNDEEGIQWENTLTQGIPSTPYQVQTHNRGRTLQGQPGPYIPEQPVTKLSGPASNYGVDPMVPTGNYSPQELQAAKQGVNIDANAGVDTYRANFAAKKEKRDAIVTQLIKDSKGPRTLVRTGADSLSGDVEWYDEDAKQWKTAGNSLKGQIPNAIPQVGEAAGGIGGALLPFLGGPGVSSAVGAGLGRGFGQFVKNKMGEAMGVEDDLRDQPSATSEGLKAGGLNLGLNAVTSGLPAGARLLFRGEDVADVEAAKSILSAYKKNSTMVDQINAALAGNTDKRITLSTARQAAIPNAVSGDTNIAAANLAAKEPLLLISPELADRERARRLANESALELYWMNEVSNPHAVPNLTQANWQDKMKDLYDAAKEGRLGPYQKNVDAALQQAEQAAKEQPQLGELNATKGGQLVRNIILKASEESKDKEKAAWANYQTQAKYHVDGFGSDMEVPITSTVRGTMKALKELKKKALLDTQKSQASRYNLNIKEPLSEEDVGLLKDFDIPESSGTMDLAVLDRTIKDLRKEGSQALKGQVQGDISDANRNRLLSNLVDARTTFMAKQKPEMQTALAEAEAETSRHHQEFDQSFVGQFLVHDSAYELHVADANVLDRIMKSGDKTGAKELAAMVNGTPGAKKAIMDYVYAYYNKHYTNLKDGVRSLDPNKHQLFKEEVLPYVRPFMDQADAAQISQYGGFSKALVRTQKQYNAAVDAWKKTDSGKLGQRLGSETFVNQFFQPNKSFAEQNYNFIKKYIGEEGLEKTKAGIMLELTDRARNDTTGRIDVNKLSGLIAPIKDRMEKYFGKTTVNNIDRFVTVSQAMEREFPVSAPRPTGATPVSEASRVIFGPLSAENRKITFLKNLRVRSEAARLEQALYNPEELPRLIKEIEGRRSSTAVKSATGAVILSQYDQ